MTVRKRLAQLRRERPDREFRSDGRAIRWRQLWFRGPDGRIHPSGHCGRGAWNFPEWI